MIDYGRVYLLGLYLKEQFNNEIIKEVLGTSFRKWINFLEFLKNQLDLNKFINWLIANIVNDCSLGKTLL